jgi:hypothetical protein
MIFKKFFYFKIIFFYFLKFIFTFIIYPKQFKNTKKIILKEENKKN